jgi:hypothetical protein
LGAALWAPAEGDNAAESTSAAARTAKIPFTAGRATRQ